LGIRNFNKSMDALMSKSIPLTIVSDFACPWCLIGKRHLDEAIAQLPDLDIVIDWQPFQLNPDMPRSGINREDYYEHKLGPQQNLWVIGGVGRFPSA
jgi:predicted DsbA family dithiol-disulfide isomerase